MYQKINTLINALKTDKSILCTRPWTSLEERSLAGDYRICCFINNNLGKIGKNSNDDLLRLWNTARIKQIQLSFIEGSFHIYCPADCPILIRKRFIQPDYTDFFEYDPSEYETFSSEFRDNREKIISSLSNKRILLEAFPLRLKLHPSNTCNLNCRMCMQDKSRKEEIGAIYYENTYRLMPYLEELIIFGGEPFACKTTREIIFGEEIKKFPHIHFSTLTNGTLLDDRIIEKLKRLKLGSFSFSIDSCNEKTYEQIRINARYATTFSNIENFVKKRDNGEIRIRDIEANFTIQNNNYHEIKEFVRFTNSLNIRSGFGFVTDSYELHDKIDEVRMSIKEGISAAQVLGDDAASRELGFLLDKLPEYEAKIKKLYFYFKLLDIVDKDKVIYFMRRHNKFRLFLKKIIGL